MLTITGGTQKGRNVSTTRRKITRYTPKMARKALFDIIPAPEKLLDVFSGSGIVAFEALSRGTSYVVCVDSSRTSAKTIRKNALELGLKKQIEIICKDFRRAFAGIEKKNNGFDVVFADPPFNRKYVDDFFSYLTMYKGLIAANTMVVIETSENEATLLKNKEIEDLKLFDQRKYGGVFLNFLKVIK
ncbi:MAG: 16S rRNA (guanine(966)-N(2))-methyltransferase RsmD [Kosmotogaceae bacterium]